MKFDFIIGNPPYQDETIGDNKTFAPPIYHKFIDGTYELSDHVELIHPARFLFNAGHTPKQWNHKMLSDPYLKVLNYFSDSRDVFLGQIITGGIAITYHDLDNKNSAIETFTQFEELNSIFHKVYHDSTFLSLSKIVVTAYAYRLTDRLYQDHPEATGKLSEGHAYDMKSNVFEKLPQVFFDERPTDENEYILILGRISNQRAYKYIRTDYVGPAANLYKFKVFIGGANGASGALGNEAARIITPPVLGEPGVGSTESFLSIGSFSTKKEAVSLQKYIKTKFARALLGILKVTQAVTPEKWKYVPLQDFTASSDIDWSKSIPEIDKQLYAKYGLDDDEIAFIESHVKEMA